MNLSSIENKSSVSLNLKKNTSLDLSKKSNLRRIRVGLGWEATVGNGANYDLDAIALLLNSKRVLNDNQDVIFYNQPNTNRGVWAEGDNRVGSYAPSDDEDEETIRVELNSVPPVTQEILFIVNIFECVERHQNFGQVKNAYIRVFDDETGEELCRYDITENFSLETTVEVAKLIRTRNGWEFKAIGEGTKETLEAILLRYGAK